MTPNRARPIDRAANPTIEMRTSPDETEAHFRGARGGRGESWGIRIGVDPFREVVKTLEAKEPATFDQLVTEYERKHGVNRDGRPKRSTVRAILQTMTHLGVVAIAGREYRLSGLGKTYAASIGSRAEAEQLSRVLLHYPPFQSLWFRLRDNPEVRHSEISGLFAKEFFYAPRPAANFSAFFIGFATRAMMLRKHAGKQTYEVVLQKGENAIDDPGEDQVEPEAVRPSGATAQRSAGRLDLARAAVSDLSEVARELGLVLADPAWLARPAQRERLHSQLAGLRAHLQGEGLSRIQKVAIELALQGLTRSDDRALRWSIQCFNGLIEAGRAP